MLPPAPTVPDPFARLRRASRPSPGVSGSQPKHFCFGGFPFARPSPEGSSLAGLRRKWDRLAPHASSSIALPVASLAFIPKDVRRVRGGNVRKLSFLSERPSPATPIDCHARRFDERGIRLWIIRISGISPGGDSGDDFPAEFQADRHSWKTKTAKKVRCRGSFSTAGPDFHGITAGLQYFAAFAAFAVPALLAMLLPGRRANMAVLLVFLSLYPIFTLIGPLPDLWPGPRGSPGPARRRVTPRCRARFPGTPSASGRVRQAHSLC